MSTHKFIVACCATVSALTANPAAVRSQTVGTLLVAHGGDSVWNSLVRDVAKLVKVDGPIDVSFLMGPEASRTRFQDAVSRLAAKGAQSIVAVPLLVSSHSGHYEQIRFLAGLTDSLDAVMREHLHHSGIERPAISATIHVTPALDGAIELARVLADRARALEPDPGRHALMLVGHGPNSAEDYAAWMRHLRLVADSVARWSGFRDVRVELLREDAPAPVRAEAVHRLRDLVDLQYKLTGQPVVVVPILISRGGIPSSRITRDLAGLQFRYAGDPLLPHPAIAHWIAASVRSAAPR